MKGTNFISGLLKNIIFLHGISGGGKGEITKVLQTMGRENKVNITYLSSGDCFRATLQLLDSIPVNARSSEEHVIADLLDKTMRVGKYVPTLHPAMPPLTDKVKDYVESYLKGKKVALILDGFLRLGSFNYNNEAMGIDKEITVPSQMFQISEAILRGIKSAIFDNPDLAKEVISDHELLNLIMEHQNIDYWEVVESGLVSMVNEGIINESSHSIVDIPSADAEALMRFRSNKALKEMREKIIEVTKDKEISERTKKTLNLLDEVILIQSGINYSYIDGELVVSPESEDRSLVPFSFEEGQNADARVDQITQQIYENLDDGAVPQKKDLAKAMGIVKLRVESETRQPICCEPVRVDDLYFGRRINRVNEYRLAEKGVLQDGLGLGLVINQDNETIPVLKDERYNITFVENGPHSRNISYKTLQMNARRAGEAMFSRFSFLELESSTVERV